eukprot:PhF_6_TR37794/c0_g1_i1/m.56265
MNIRTTWYCVISFLLFFMCCLFASQRSATDISMPLINPITLVVEVVVPTNKVEEFLEVMAVDARDSPTLEKECYQFDVIEVVSNSMNDSSSGVAVFIVYEVFRDDDAILYHRTTPHYLKWRKFRESGGVVSVKPKKGIRKLHGIKPTTTKKK